jgi:catechol 2,3-dioxygenase-like lactoylglutathione lyase family enzyme
MNHLAIPVRDQTRSRWFYETYLGFGARPAKRYDDGVLMLYNAEGFALALGASADPLNRPGVVGDFWPWKRGRSYAHRSWSWKASEPAVFG